MLVGCSVKSLNLNLNTSGSKLRTRGRISKLRQANFEQERASKTYGRTLRSSVWIYKPLQNYFERKAGMQNLWKQSSVKGLNLTNSETKLRTIAWISKPLNANFGGEAELQNFDSIQFDSIQFISIQFNSIRHDSIQLDSVRFNSNQFDWVRAEWIQLEPFRLEWESYYLHLPCCFEEQRYANIWNSTRRVAEHPSSVRPPTPCIEWNN
jgi:hypothetical protein